MAVAKLNEFTQKHRLELRYEDVGSVGLDHIKTFTVRAVVNGKWYDGVGKNKKEAKLIAATNALSVLLEETIDPTENAKEASASAPQTGISQAKYVCWLNEYGQKNRLMIRAVESTEPLPNGVSQCCHFVVGDKEYPRATGKTKKEAKEEAAKLVHHEINGIETTEIIKEEHCGTPSKESKELNMSDICDKMKTMSVITEEKGFKETNRDSKDQNTGNSQNETSIQSKFTSEFDDIEWLASGVFGNVYKAREKLLQKYFAVKIVRSETKVLREADTLSDLHHPNIVRYYTSWMEDSEYQEHPESTDSSAESSAGYSSSQATDDSSAKYFYIQLELCDTKTLKDWIDEKNKESLQDPKRREEGLRIVQQIVSGVEYIHSKKHIHRDLKPPNVLFGLAGEVKIGDFGLVTTDDVEEALIDRTADSGTRPYMAPEQSETNYDRKVDIFAMGLIFLEILWKVSSGHERATIFENAKRQKLPTEFLQMYPQEMLIIKLMLRTNPEERPEATEVKAELETCVRTLNAQNIPQRNATV
ncbi:interferon-induced, double-stranded RNA-activated protein kinase-like isoform X2 [Pungitius pungitius]|uniref:interferon-induced, double-stranded RNA-activated protein kinase-like isoform X2 n=1 Tax=Pungitius pungitius TaxID=134920 RepID=UPI002E0E6FAA